MDAVRQHMRGVCGDVLDQLKGDNHEVDKWHELHTVSNINVDYHWWLCTSAKGVHWEGTIIWLHHIWPHWNPCEYKWHRWREFPLLDLTVIIVIIRRRGAIEVHHLGSCYQVIITSGCLHCSGQVTIDQWVWLKVVLQGHRAVCTKSLNMFAEQLKHLHCPVEYTKQSVFIHSYRERYPLQP